MGCYYRTQVATVDGLQQQRNCVTGDKSHWHLSLLELHRLIRAHCTDTKSATVSLGPTHQLDCVISCGQVALSLLQMPVHALYSLMLLP